MAHDHHHHHHHHHDRRRDYTRAFAIGVLLNSGFVVAEVVYGLSSHSLALLADAGHNFGDVLGLLIAWGANVLTRRSPSARFTYGLRSSSILAGLFNAIALLVATGAIMLEAIERLQHPEPLAAATVITVALLGVVVNAATAIMLAPGHEHDLNIRAAYLHMAADAAISIGVAIAGLLILLTGWTYLDPAVSLVVSVLIVIATWGLLKDSLKLALHAVPADVDPVAVKDYLANVAGVAAVHDLHIWGMSTTEIALTAHLVMPDGNPGDAFLAQIAHELSCRFHIGHATIQVEMGDPAHPCALAPAHTV